MGLWSYAKTGAGIVACAMLAVTITQLWVTAHRTEQETIAQSQEALESPIESAEKAPETPKLAPPREEAVTPPERTTPTGSRDDYIGAPQTQGSRHVVLVIHSSGTIDGGVTGELAARLETSASFFRPAFVLDGLFARAHDGDSRPLEWLDLGQEVEVVVLGEKTFAERDSDEVHPGLVTIETSISVRIYYPRRTFSSEAFIVDGRGAGFSARDAQRMADETAVEELIDRITNHPE